MAHGMNTQRKTSRSVASLCSSMLLQPAFVERWLPLGSDLTAVIIASTSTATTTVIVAAAAAAATVRRGVSKTARACEIMR